jgi:chromosome segregation ATPase
MREFEKQVKRFTYSNYTDFNKVFSLLMFSCISFMVVLFSLFLLINVFVKQSLTDNNTEISRLLGVKAKQEKIISNKSKELSKVSKSLKLTEKDLKDRIKTNKFLNYNLKNEKDKTAKLKNNVSSLEKLKTEKEQALISAESSNKDLFSNLEIGKEEINLLKEDLVQKNKDIDLLKEKLAEQISKTEDLQNDYDVLKNNNVSKLDYIEELESKTEDLKSQIESLKNKLLNKKPLNKTENDLI